LPSLVDDLRIAAAQLGGDIVLHRCQPLLAGIDRIGLEQQMATPGEIEPKADSRMRQEPRQPLRLRFGQQAGDREDHSQQHDQPDHPHFPLREIEH